MIAKMRNGGEACTAANRFYVQQGILDAFAKGLTERMAAMTVGAGYDPATRCGPMINAEAVTRISDLVTDATDRGARLLSGGKPLDREGFFFPPTVLDGVPTDAKIAQRRSSARSPRSPPLPPRTKRSPLPTLPTLD